MTFFDKVVESFYESIAFRAESLVNGSMTEIPLANYKFCLFMNIFYFAMLVFLYFFMKNREAYKLKPFMIFYNITCIILAGTCLYGGLYWYVYKAKSSFYCNSFDLNDPISQNIHFYYLIFHFQKYWEFLDTFIFMLRKSYRQVTLLHVYHHSSITITTLLINLYYPAGDNTIAMIFNSFIHVLMYTHYLCSALKIKVWWRQYLTQLQLIQFVLIFVCNLLDIIKGTCQSPLWFNVYMLVYMITMLVLFGNFYIQRYLKPAEKPKAN